jgi:hypothetical protein
MKSICIVPCGKTKIWDKNEDAGPTPAKNVYIGVFARKCQAYAQAFFGENYLILSAKHGFLWPDDIIPENYNVTFKCKNPPPISLEALIQIANEKDLYTYDRFVIIAGKVYAQYARAVFPGKEISTPLEHCHGNGEMMHVLKEAIRTGEPLISNCCK